MTVRVSYQRLSTRAGIFSSFMLPPSSIAQKNPPPARVKTGAAGARGLRAGHALNGDREDPVDQCARSVSRQSLQRDRVQTFLAVILDRVRRRENARGIRLGLLDRVDRVGV